MPAKRRRSLAFWAVPGRCVQSGALWMDSDGHACWGICCSLRHHRAPLRENVTVQPVPRQSEHAICNAYAERPATVAGVGHGDLECANIAFATAAGNENSECASRAHHFQLDRRPPAGGQQVHRLGRQRQFLLPRFDGILERCK